jgi:cell pole-organizing protein PopZ
MSSPGQATDLSMDEILASIRKIISEDPKPAATVVPARAPATDGMLTAAHTARQNVPVKSAPSANGEPASVQHAVQHAARPTKPALDEDVLDLTDEDKSPVRAHSAPQVAAAPVKSEPALSATEYAVQAEQPARPGLNELWAPREWGKPAVTAAVEPQPLVNPPSAAPAVTASTVEPTEAGLEAAIAALGQSLASPQSSAPPARPFASATASKAPPGPRIDVVAVVNAATRAALGQRSADEQMAMPVSAVPSAPPAVAESQTRPHVAASPSVPKSAETVPERQGPVGAPVEAPVVPAMAAPAVAPAVNAAVEAALAAARAAPPRGEVAKAPEVPKLPDMPKQPEPVAVAKPSLESALAKAAVPLQPAVAEAPKRIIPIPVSPASSVSAAVTPISSNPTASVAAALPPQAPAAGVQTLEDTVARLLRPMLRQWLDDNMPRIVEKAFKEELAAQAAPPPSPPRVAN